MTIEVIKTISSLDKKCQNVIVRPRPSVKRCLFGKVDHEESMLFLKKELDSIAEKDNKKWNFDFSKEQPLEPSDNYEWIPVNTISFHPPKQSATNNNSRVTTLKQTSLDSYIKKTKRILSNNPASEPTAPAKKKICM